LAQASNVCQANKFDQHLNNLRTSYRSRYEKLIQQLALKLPQQCQVKPVLGSMLIWLTLPDCNVFQLAHVALENGVAVVPGSVFYPQGEKQAGAEVMAWRLNFTNASEEQLTLAVDRLSSALNQCIF